jgi:hypothetical protein
MAKLSFRVDQRLFERLQAVADARQCGLSDVLRRAVSRFLEGQGADSPEAPRPLAPPAPPASGAARRRWREQMPSWQEFKGRVPQDAGAPLPAPDAPALLGAAESASTPAASSGG